MNTTPNSSLHDDLIADSVFAEAVRAVSPASAAEWTALLSGKTIGERDADECLLARIRAADKLDQAIDTAQEGLKAYARGDEAALIQGCGVGLLVIMARGNIAPQKLAHLAVDELARCGLNPDGSYVERKVKP